MIIVRRRLATAIATLAVIATSTAITPTRSSARPDPAAVDETAHRSVGIGRTDERFWGQSCWLNALSGLNVNRASVS